MNKITKQNGTLLVPDKVVIPFIEGDGVGAEITPVCQRIVDEAVGRAYGGQRVIDPAPDCVGGAAKFHFQPGVRL